MSRRFALSLPFVGMLMLLAFASVAGAASRFAETEQISDTGSLVLNFQEGSLKKYGSVDYRLQATASAFWDAGGGQSIGVLFDNPPPSVDAQFAPDDKGRVSGVMQLDIPGGGSCTCGGGLLQANYWDVTLMNLATGHVYRLDPISRDFP
jgi:hypothetical protein